MRYYENVNEKSVVDKNLFWTVKLLLLDNIDGKDKIHFIENDELVKIDLEAADCTGFR